MKTALITLIFILHHFSTYGDSQFKRIYNQNIVGHPEIEKVEWWKNSIGEPTFYLSLTLNLSYETFDSCQVAVGLKDSNKNRGRKSSSDYQLLMASRTGFCMTSMGVVSGSFTLPNPVKIGSRFKISDREFSVENQQGRIVINEVH